MTKYKQGDRVRFIHQNNYNDSGFTVGNYYIVKEIFRDIGYNSGYVLSVEEDDAGRTNNGWCLSFFEPAYIKEFNNKLEELINE